MITLNKFVRAPSPLGCLAATTLVAALCAAGLSGFGVAGFGPSSAAAAGVSLRPVADAYVDSSQPTLNTGTQAQLRVDGSPAVRALLRFDLRSIGGPVTSARLVLFAASASSGGMWADATNSSGWTETAVTWSNDPALGTRIATTGAVAAGSTVSLDVTPAVQAGRLVDLALGTSGATAISLGSRESAHPPVLSLTTASSATPVSTPTRVATGPSGGSTDPVLIGAGDICITSIMGNAAATARLIEARPTAHVFTLGDNSNEAGTASQYAGCYGKTWGPFLGRTRATVGNHDYGTSNAGPYFTYFGAAAGPAGKGYYSYNLPNNWHVIVLNSQGSQVGGVGVGSPQETWLRKDLAANPGKHIIAMWHIPVFSSGLLYRNAYLPFWQDLYAAHADIVMSGHDHIYERFALQNPSGKADPNGIRQFTVGTGGATPQQLGSVKANSQVRHTGTFGVLMLTLHAHSYDWKFIPIAGQTWTDSGSQATHS